MVFQGNRKEVSEMAKLTRKQLDEAIKLRFLEGVSEHLENCGEEVQHPLFGSRGAEEKA
jgi:hypothetical protein